jgi:hypothetical protein
MVQMNRPRTCYAIEFHNLFSRSIRQTCNVGAWKIWHFAGPPVSVRERQVDALNLHHRQLIDSALIRTEAIGGTEAHSKVAMKYQAK